MALLGRDPRFSVVLSELSGMYGNMHSETRTLTFAGAKSVMRQYQRMSNVLEMLGWAGYEVEIYALESGRVVYTVGEIFNKTGGTEDEDYQDQ